MKNRRRPVAAIFFLLTVISVLISGIPLFGQTGRFALVIGNGNYAALGKLKNPVNDARDLGEALKSLGFQVDVLADADLSSMEDAVVRLGNRLSISQDCIGFFFYAGHGVQSGGINYLVPTDAHIASESFLKTRALAAQEVLDVLSAARNTLNIVVLDACRDNPFSWARSGTRGLSVVSSQPPGSIVAYATSAGSVAQDGAGRNGVFTAELLKNIAAPGMEIAELFKRTGAAVQANTAGAQVPAVYNQYFGSTFLAGSTALAQSTAKKPTLTVERAYGSVSVVAKSKGTLYLNGEAMGELTPGALARIDDVETGKVSVEMRYAGGKTETSTADVAKNTVTAVTFTYVERPKATESMVLVEGGTFQMGTTDASRHPSERPAHLVTVSSFLMGKYEVTVGEFRRFVEETSYATSAEGGGGAEVFWVGKTPERKKDASWKNPYFPQTERNPVVCVSWVDAAAYCNWLSGAEGLAEFYRINADGTVAVNWSANGYRLPTEAEWEYAARGGKKGQGTSFSGSNDMGEAAWYDANSGGSTHTVGTKKPNELGLYDMSGNVGEWCNDWFAGYTESTQTDPRGPQSGTFRAYRGASWCDPDAAISTFRDSRDQGDHFNRTGFRIARAP
jgi:formylglycine-generating enzyme required for sulfatase activity